MKTIGFVDYYISEWHANNYPNWINGYCKKTGKDFVVKYAFAEKDVSPVDGKTTNEWCKENGVIQCNSISELCEKSDFIIVLAPSNPEKHLGYAKEVLKYSKRTYIDKTFAENFEVAKQIFDIANEYKTKFFSTSALRFSDELKNVNDVALLTTEGGGSNFEEYIIHQIEMIVKILGVGAKKVKTELNGNDKICTVCYPNATATVNYSANLPFKISFTDKNGKTNETQINSPFFNNLIKEIITFFETGIPPFDLNETLEVMKIRENLIKGQTLNEQWINL